MVTGFALLAVFISAFLLAAALLLFLSRKERAKGEPMKLPALRNNDGGLLAFAPDVVAIGGGTGLSTLLSGLKQYTRNITAVVAVTDEGGSSGRLRHDWGVLPPGDIRNCIVALAENDSSLNRLLNFRFDKGELAGHSLGNLILLAATEMTGDFQKAVEELNNLLAIRGQVLPVTTENVTLKGETASGDTVVGELAVSDNGSSLEKLWLEPSYAEPLPAVLAAIKTADIILLGPGSLFTSVLPNLLLEKISKALKEADAPVVYIANLITQPKETEGMNILAHIDWLASVLGTVPDYVIANQEPIPDEFVERYEKIGADPLYLSVKEEKYLQSLGTKIVYGNYVTVKDGKYIRHNAQNLSETIMDLAQGNAGGRDA